MEGKGITLTCHACGKAWEMDKFGQLKATEGETEYPHIPDWYEIADMIGFGNKDAMYYCFTRVGVSVAKARMAVEELYKLKKKRRVKVEA